MGLIKIIFIIISLSVSSVVLGERPVKFLDSLTWNQVLSKAKAEGKYIFMDCYASWCGPCKAMEKTFDEEGVANYLNSHFLCVRVQMDSTNHDDAFVKAWYESAHTLMLDYAVNAFPTYLFFSPDGGILHRDIGFKEEQEFISVLTTALNPTEEYYVLINNYSHVKKDYEKLPYLIDMAKKFGDRKLAKDLASDYVNNYLFTQNEELIYSRKSLLIIASTIQRSQDKGFELFMKEQDRIDKIIGSKGFTYQLLEKIIYNEEIAESINAKVKEGGSEPDWSYLANKIIRKYGNEFSKNVILDGQIHWYESHGDWNRSAKCIIDRIELMGVDTSGGALFGLNNILWADIFERCNDSKILRKAVKLQKIVVEHRPWNPDYVDTYANLLYKSGKVARAVSWEKKAIKLDQKDKGHSISLEKMKKGKPTWGVAG